MSHVSDIALVALVREQIARPSPIRQIMKMAERQNILAMGLNPEDVISFGGGWVNHPAPEPLRQAYVEIAADAASFHKSGGYTATLGDWRMPRAAGALRDAPLRRPAPRPPSTSRSAPAARN